MGGYMIDAIRLLERGGRRGEGRGAIETKIPHRFLDLFFEM